MDVLAFFAPWLRSGGCVRGLVRTIGRLVRGCAPNGSTLRKKVRAYNTDEFAGRDYLCLFPELWKMALVACNQVVGAGGVGLEWH